MFSQKLTKKFRTFLIVWNIIVSSIVSAFLLFGAIRVGGEIAFVGIPTIITADLIFFFGIMHFRKKYKEETK